jgi:DNA polymerase-3 subunit alpha
MPEFTHLHVHTQFSILDGAAEINTLVTKAKEYGMKAIAITDHGNMYGVVKFVDTCKKHGIKPIIGCEVYVADGSRTDKRGKEDRSGHHLILLAKNKEGYHNLSKLCSKGYLEGFYYTPRIDKELLKEYHEGLIASSACLGGEIPDAIMHKGIEKAEEILIEYLEIFGEDFYLELQRHGYPEQTNVNEALVKLAEKFNIKLIATNDVHFVNEEDAEAHDILVCLNTGKDFDDPNRMKYSGNEFLKSPEVMAELFHDYPEALANTMEVSDKIEFIDLAHDIILPVFPLPDGFESEDDYLLHLTYEGAKTRYPGMDETTKERIDFELSVVKKMGFPGYFLIVADFINEARKMGVMVGPGRGSAAGSVVAYCVGITNVDPLKYNLLFERFLNPERISMPDVDIDFDDDGRQKVLDYVIGKYGQDKVAQIVTFGTMAARSAIRDVARVLKLPLQEADRLAKLVPEGVKVSLKKAYEEVPELKEARKNGSVLVQKTLTFAKILEGSSRHTGTHACGVIIGPDSLIEHIPLAVQKDSPMPVTQYEGKLVESVGMLKMDFLGLKTLSIIKDAIVNIQLRHGITIDIDEIPLDDTKTFELYSRGDTSGTFQFESDGMRKYLQDLKPNRFEDLIAMNALYRPGPIQYIPSFINRKFGREKIEYDIPIMEEHLKETYGITVYQEQVMLLSQKLAGFTKGDADSLRKAMGKKQKDVMDKMKEKFIAGCKANELDIEKANKVWKDWEAFAEYAFNKSHSTCYSLVAYQTAYLKAHYPAEYMAAVLSRNVNDLTKITQFMDESKKIGIPVLSPDINESQLNFFVNPAGAIRFGLSAVKGIGEAAVESLIEERNANGPFTDAFDLVKRINLRTVNKRCLDAMVMSGAFDSFENSHRAQYFFQEHSEDSSFIEKIIKHGNNVQGQADSAQHSLFGEEEEVQISDPKLPVCEPWTKLQQLKLEREVTGIYLSGHPLDDFRLEMNNFCNVKIQRINEDLKSLKGRELSFAGIITSMAHKTTKTGKPFGSFVLEDYTDTLQLAVFSEDYLKFKHFLEEGFFLHIKAKVQNRYSSDLLEIKIQSISLLQSVLEKNFRGVTIQLHLEEITEKSTENIFKLAKVHSGKSFLKLNVYDNIENLNLTMSSKKYTVNSNFAKSLDAAGYRLKIE